MRRALTVISILAMFASRADPNIQSNSDLTSLFYARQAGHEDIVKILKKAGVKK